MRTPGKGVGRTIRVVLLCVLFAGITTVLAEPKPSDPQVRKEKDWEVTTLPSLVSWRKPFLEQDRLLLEIKGKPAQLWDTRTGQRVAVFGEDFIQIGFAVLSRDGKRLVVAQSIREGNSDPAEKEKKPPIRTIHVRDLATGKVLKSIPIDLSTEGFHRGHSWRVVGWLDDDKLLVETRWYDDESRTWFATGMVIFDIQAGRIVKIGRSLVRRESWLLSPNSKRGLCGEDTGWSRHEGNMISGVFRLPDRKPFGLPTDALKVVDLVEFKVIASLPAQEPEVAGELKRRYIVARSWSPDSKWIATVSTDHAVRIWEPETGKCRMALFGHTDWLLSVAISPDSQRVVTASEDKTARIWDVATGKELLLLKGHTSGLNAAAFDPQGRFVLTGSEDGTARLWDAATGKQLRVWDDHPGPVYEVSFAPDGKEVLTRTAGNATRRWSLADGSLLEKRPAPNRYPDRYGALYLRDVGEKTEVWSGPPGAPGEKTNPEPGR
jgi:hypothetical protein